MNFLNDFNEIFVIIAISYAFGSIPFGYLITKFFLKKDIRKIGSGNIGATNVLRTGNRVIGYLTLLLDIFKAILPLMVKQNSGSIINISSCASSLKGFPNRFVYGATKGAVIGLTKAIAADFVKKNIRCNSIAPGTVFSPSWQDRVNQSPDPIQAKKDFIARQPMGRLGTAEEIAAMAVYLASDEATFTTGTTISVDGGISI